VAHTVKEMTFEQCAHFLRRRRRCICTKLTQRLILQS